MSRAVTATLMLTLIILLASTPHPGQAQASWPAPPVAPDYWSSTLDSPITVVRVSDDALYIAAATQQGGVYLYTSGGQAEWGTRLRGAVLLLDMDPDASHIVAVSQAGEIAVYTRDGALAEYWERGSRDTPRSLAYIYGSSLIVLLDASGWLYTYSFPAAPPTGRGESWVLDYTYTSPSYNVSTVTSPTGFEDMSPLHDPSGPLAEIVVPVYVNVQDNRTGTMEVYAAPMLRFYSASTASNLANTILSDLKDYEIDAIHYYTMSGTRYVAVAAHRASGEVTRPGDYVLKLYNVENAVSTGAGTAGSPPPELQATWTYSLGGVAVELAATPGGDRLLAASQDFNIYSFEKLPTGGYNLTWSASLGAKPTDMDSSQQGKVVGATEDGWVYMYDTLGDRLWRAPLDEGVSTLDLTPTATMLAVGSGNTLHVFKKPDRAMRLLEVELYDEEKGYIAGANVTVRNNLGTVVLKDQTPALFLLPTGIYTVTVDHLEIGIYAQTVELSSDRILVVPTAKLVQPTYTLTLRVYDNETSAGIEGASIILHNTLTDTYYQASTGPGGEASIAVPRGPYQLEVQHTLYKGYSQDLGWLLGSKTLEVRLNPIRVTLSVAVYSPIDGPVEGATITLEGPETIQLTTGAGGLASAEVRLGSYTITITAEHHETAQLSIEVWKPLQLRVELTPLNYTLKLVALDWETGQALDSFNIRVAGPLGISFEATITQQNNTLSLPYGTYTVEVANYYYYPATQQIFLDKSSVLTLRLKPVRVSLLVKVLSPVDGPVTGANITLEGPETLTTISAEGQAYLNPRLGNYTLRVVAPHHYEYTASIEIAESTVHVALLEPRNYTLTVTALDAELSRPITFWIQFRNLELGEVYNYTGGAGAAAFQVPYGTYQIRVGSTGFRTVVEDGVRIDEDLEKTYKLQPIRVPLTISVISGSVGALEGALVQLSLPGVENLTATTDNTGLAVFNARLATYTVTVSADYHHPFHGNISVANTTTMTVYITPKNYTLTLIATDSRTGEPIPIYRAEVRGPMGISLELVLTPQNSSITMPYGTYMVILSEDHYRPSQIDLVLKSDTTVKEPLEPLMYSVSVTVTSTLDEILAQALVEAYWRGQLYSSAYTNEQGTAILVLPYGTYTINVTAKHHEPIVMEIMVDQALNLALKAEPTLYNFTATIVDSEFRTKLPSGTVTLSRNGKPYGKYNFTNGVFIVMLPYGEYSAKVLAPDHVEGQFIFTLANKTSIEWKLAPIEYTVTIRVLDDRGKPLEGATLLISGPRTFTAYTGPDGTFSATLRSGSYTVRIRYSGYQDYVLSINVPGPLEHTVRMRPFISTLVKRYLPLIVALIVIPGAVASIAYYLRRRRLKEFEEEILEEEEVI